MKREVDNTIIIFTPDSSQSSWLDRIEVEPDGSEITIYLKSATADHDNAQLALSLIHI